MLVTAAIAMVACGSGSQSLPPAREPTPSRVSEPSHAEHEDRDAVEAQDTSAAPIGPEASELEPAARDLVADERVAYEHARPVFEKHCAKCHSTSGASPKKVALQHFTMDEYPFGGHHASEIGAAIREVLGAAGEEASMPRDNPGAVQGDELASVLAWAEAFDRADAAGLHGQAEEHHHGETAQ